MIQQTTTTPVPGQLIVNVEDVSMLNGLKKAISMLRGVTKITISRRKPLSDYERSIRDLEAGNVREFGSVDDYFKSMGV
jgi:hypothetical protein